MAQTSLFGIGISGLKAAQFGLNTAGHNVSNANTEGYSRQRVEFSSRNGAFSGAGFQGAGVQTEGITRLADRFLTGQLRIDTAGLTSAETYLDNATAIDDLLADEQTGLAPGLAKFFAALQEASGDPTAIPARRLVISEANSLVARMHALHDRLHEQDAGVGAELGVSAERVTTLARGIADLNVAIAQVAGNATPPNDLLDRRDALLRELSEQVDVQVVSQADGLTNVFIGTGQILVVGGEASRLDATGDGRGVVLTGNAAPQDVTNFMSGGRIGGLLRFRRELLDTTFDGLGRTALVLAQSINEQHARGVDLTGNFGGNLFADINDSRTSGERVQRLSGMGVVDARLHIDDAATLSGSDYELQFNGPSDNVFRVRRASDGVIVAHGEADGFPVVVSFDSLRLELRAGEFRAGDKFALRPTRFGARDTRIVLGEPTALALASPLRTTASVSNRGSGAVVGTTVLDPAAPAFAVPGKLAPPLVVRFTSESTYDVLDASDPTSLRQLDPPLRNLPFVPGSRNALLPGANGERLAQSDGGRAGRLPLAATTAGSRALVRQPPGNGYFEESLTFTVDAGSGARSQTVRTAAGASARSIAASINGAQGVLARASSEVTLSALRQSNSTPPLGITINGRTFSGEAVRSLGHLADAITADAGLRDAGIRATSDGQQLVLRSVHGDDLVVGVIGVSSDGLRLLDARGGSLELTGAGQGLPATLRGTTNLAAGFDFRTGGPYEFSLAVDGGAAARITLDSDYADSVELVAGMQSRIDAAIGGGRVRVAIDSQGRVSLLTTRSNASAELTLGDAPIGSPFARVFGLANATAQGEDQVNAATIGGDVQLLLSPGVSFDATVARPGGSLFRDVPTVRGLALGYQIEMGGRPAEGDRFEIGFNSRGGSDNRNALALAGLQDRALIGDGTTTLADSYGEVVQVVGAKTSAARLDAAAAESLLQQSTALRSAYSGVDLDEEAADLLRFEQAYTASARVIATARSVFDSLLSIFN